ncbi:MAG: twin-arginine translocase TatA/TatE family subunit [Actinomycetota bacterium]
MIPNLGWGEILVLAVIGLLVFGPKRLPEIGAQVGRGLREFRRATQGTVDELKAAVDLGLNAPDKPKPPQETPSAGLTPPEVSAPQTDLEAT